MRQVHSIMAPGTLIDNIVFVQKDGLYMINRPNRPEDISHMNHSRLQYGLEITTSCVGLNSETLFCNKDAFGLLQ